VAGQKGAPADGGAGRHTISTTLITKSAATLIAVLQFWTSALRRVLATLIAATMARSVTAASF